MPIGFSECLYFPLSSFCQLFNTPRWETSGLITFHARVVGGENIFSSPVILTLTCASEPGGETQYALYQGKPCTGKHFPPLPQEHWVSVQGPPEGKLAASPQCLQAFAPKG